MLIGCLSGSGRDPLTTGKLGMREFKGIMRKLDCRVTEDEAKEVRLPSQCQLAVDLVGTGHGLGTAQ